jgi:hypothetical protein
LFLVAPAFRLRLDLTNHQAGADMIEYRANLIDRSGHIIRAEMINSSDDATAVTAAEKLVNATHDVVVWQQNRLLVRLSHGCRG